MKIWKRIIIIFIILLLLCIPAFFMYTRLCLDIYIIKDNTLIFENNIYVQSGGLSITDEENTGKTIGIAIQGKRTITDYIWPNWVIGFKNDNDHNRLMVRGLMDLGTVYSKNEK